MFTPGRYIVIDDESDELRLLVESLHSIGAPCVGIHYTGRALDPTMFAGTRILFCDLHLIPGANARTQYATIEALLRNNINPISSGPYLLVLWTKHNEEAGELGEFLEERLEPARKPLAVIGLDKTLYLIAGQPPRVNDLIEAIREKIGSSAQLRALLSWETDVLAAAAATLAEVTELVGRDKRSAREFSAELDRVLSRLAVAAVGKPNVDADRRSAINTVLAPILADRILNQPVRAHEKGVWESAITQQMNLPVLDSGQIGRMNRMLHLSMPSAEAISPKAWGAVVELSAEETEDGRMLQRFGMKYPTLMNDILLISRPDRPKCKLVLVRIGAVCDYAQQKIGPIPFVLGALVPITVKRRDATALKSELELPVFEIDPAQGPVRLFINARFQISIVDPPATWIPLFRVREQALMMIAAHCAEYATRPGIVKLPE